MGQFKMDFVSDSEHEDMAVELSYNDQRLCQLRNCDGQANIEFLTDLYVYDERVLLKFPLDEFMEALSGAVDALATLQ